MTEGQELYNMKLHQQLTILGGGAIVVRVAGGWIYRIGGNDVGVFVPFDNEFQAYDYSK